MARKISHTKRGTFYNGPTGRRKTSDPLGALFSVAGAIGKASKTRSKRKSSTNLSSSFNNVYSNNSAMSGSKTGCIILSIVLLLFIIIYGFLINKCFGSHSSKNYHKRHHSKRYRPYKNTVIGALADPWNCLKQSI